MAEIELNHLSQQCLDRRMADQAVITKEVLFWCQERNSKEMEIDWQFTTTDARIKLKKLYPVLVETGQT